MSTAPGTETAGFQRRWQSTLAPASTAEPAAWHRDETVVAVLVTRVIDLSGDVGVAMCFLPQDISLRAYAIAAIKSVAASHGLDIPGRRDVPIRPDAIRGELADFPHVAQFFIRRSGMVDADAFEMELRQLKGSIEWKLISMGLTDEDFRLISCSSRQVMYAMPGHSGDPMAFYPDLSDVQVDFREIADARRSLGRA